MAYSSMSSSRTTQSQAHDAYLAAIIKSLPQSDATDFIAACNWDAKNRAKYAKDMFDFGWDDPLISSSEIQELTESLNIIYRMLPIEHLNILLTCPTAFVRQTALKYKEQQCASKSNI